MKKYLFMICMYFTIFSHVSGMSYEAFTELDDEGKDSVLRSTSQIFFPSYLETEDDVKKCYTFITEKALFKESFFTTDLLMFFVWNKLNTIVVLYNLSKSAPSGYKNVLSSLYRLIDQFIVCGFDINAQDSKTGQTLLHQLAKQHYSEDGAIEVLKFLMSHGANPLICDFQKNTPLSYAESHITSDLEAISSSLYGENRKLVLEKFSTILNQWRGEIAKAQINVAQG